MDYFKEKQFFFASKAPGLDSKTFSVVKFMGQEGLSTPYRFEITLISRNADIDVDAVLANPATLFLKPDGKLPIHGVLTNFKQLHQVDKEIFYKAVLVPRLWNLTLYQGSRVFIDMTVKDIIEQILTKTDESGSGGVLNSKDFEFKLKQNYRKWSYVCQYQEDPLSFISRWMEREGIYYYFEQTDQSEKLIITDSHLSHVDVPQMGKVHYSPPSGLGAKVQGEVASAFVLRQKPLPQKVILQDYNYRKSPPVISGEATVSQNGKGEVYIYGEHVKDSDEANHYAKIRAEEILCRQKIFLGESTVPALRAGYAFSLDRHYRDKYNSKYLLTGITHEGSQTALLLAGLNTVNSQAEETAYYRNSIEAIPDGVQFRPERKTPKPRFYGTMNAKIEAAGDGKYAELDAFGRYKVKLPFDRSDRKGQKASRWIRMAQPYAGKDEGMHFPLRKGAEVLLTFIDGDPDRPIIAGAVPSEENRNRIIDQSATKNAIHTAGGNKLEFQDNDTKQSVTMSSPYKNTYIHIGGPNSPQKPIDVYTDGTISIRCLEDMLFQSGGTDLTLVFPDDFQKDDQGNFNFKTPDKRDMFTVVGGCSKQYTQKNTVEILGYTQETDIGWQKVIEDYSVDVSTLNRNPDTQANRQTIMQTLSNKILGTATAGDAPARLVSILGNDQENVYGFQAINISKDQTINISGKQTETVSDTQSINAKYNQVVNVKGDQKIQVGSSPADNSSGFDRYVSVDGEMRTDVSGQWEIHADQLEFYEEKRYHVNSGAQFEMFAGAKMEMLAGVSFEVNIAVQLAISLFSAEFYAFYIFAAAVIKENDGISFSEFAAKIHIGGAKVNNHVVVNNPPAPGPNQAFEAITNDML